MKKIKILQFPVANSQGGITQYVLQNWKFIDKSRFQFDFATMSKSLDFAEELEKDGCKIFYISQYAEDDEKHFNEEFRRILLQGHYDVVHLHTKQWKSFNVERIAKEVGIKKIIIHAHNTGIDILEEEKRQKEERLHYNVRERLTGGIATDYWACSKAAADFLYGDKISPDRIKIMNNAIDVKKFIFSEEIRKECRKKLKLEDKFVIGNVGRLVYQKNQEFLLKVFHEICKTRKDCILLLIGSGEKEEAYRKYVKDNCIEKNVIFLGQRKDVNNLLQAIDLFVLTSRFEGLPIGAIEAQTAGLKCLCSDKVTQEVMITDNIKLIPLEIELWESEIMKLIKPYMRRDMTDEITKAGYNILSQIKKIESLYNG